MPQITTSRYDRRYWVRILGWGAVATVTAVVIFAGVGWNTAWPRVFEGLGVSLAFTASIMPLTAFVMPRLIPFVAPRLKFPFNWIIIIAVMVALAMAGSAIAIAVLRLVGYIRPGQMRGWLAGSLRASVIMTLIFGISISALESMRARLADAALALRTKERDEAEARRLAAEAQLASLESRVQPHFLFNTLNSIAALVHDDPTRAEKMTTDLASLLRSSLDQQTTPLVPIEDEMQMVRRYLEIERVRFGDRLRYRVDVDPQAVGARVPRLAVQTLVENAVKYAVSPRREGGTIDVRAAAVDGRVRLDVRDDGPGFDPTTLPDGHGLALLRSRLAMLFDTRAALRIESAPGNTLISIELPA